MFCSHILINMTVSVRAHSAACGSSSVTGHEACGIRGIHLERMKGALYGDSFGRNASKATFFGSLTLLSKLGTNPPS